jgi:hypothetical protein
MTNEPAYGMSGEVDIYENAIRVGKGVILDGREDGTEDAYESFVQRGNLLTSEKPRKDLEVTYERWLNASSSVTKR